MGSSKKEYFARYGIASKGFVYLLSGLLISLTTLNMGGETTGRRGALTYLSDESFGRILIIAIVIGLIGYVFWRFYQGIADLDNDGKSLNGIFNRLGYLSSGLFYAALALTGIQLLIGTSSDSSFSKEEMLDWVLGNSSALVVFGSLGIIFLGRALFQLYLAYSGLFKKKVKNSKLNSRVGKLMVVAGLVGFTARGCVIGTISYLTFKSIYAVGSGSIVSTETALTQLQDSFGLLVMLSISIGLMLYGLFTILKAKYRVSLF